MLFEKLKKWFLSNILKIDIQVDDAPEDVEDGDIGNEDEKDNVPIVKQRVLWQKICHIKLDIKSFENIFKEKSNEYMLKASAFESRYIAQNQEYSISEKGDVLTVAIDPEEDLNFITEVENFYREISLFIVDYVKPQIINLRLDKYIEQINKLYLAIRKDEKSRHIQDRINEASQKLEQITSDTLNDSEKVAIMKNNSVLQNKFYKAKYLIAKIIILTNEVNGLDIVFAQDERSYYLVHLHEELDILEKKLDIFTDPSYDKLKLDFQRISNLNYLMPSEKVFSNRKFWLDFFDIEKKIYDEERRIEKKNKKAKRVTVDNSIMVSALSNATLNTTSEIKENNCTRFTKWVERVKVDNISEELRMVLDIIEFINEDISWDDIYNILTLFEVRHEIKDEITSSFNVEMQILRKIYIDKYIDSYDKLRNNKEKILSNEQNSHTDTKEYIPIIKVDDETKIMDIMNKLKIVSCCKQDKGCKMIYINPLYFSSSMYLVNVLKSKVE